MLEPAISKIKSLKFATEAAITILRIDDMIKLEKEGGGGNSSFWSAWMIYLFIYCVVFYCMKSFMEGQICSKSKSQTLK